MELIGRIRESVSRPRDRFFGSPQVQVSYGYCVCVCVCVRACVRVCSYTGDSTVSSQSTVTKPLIYGGKGWS